MKAYALILVASLAGAQITDQDDIRDLISKSPLTCSSSVRIMSAQYKFL